MISVSDALLKIKEHVSTLLPIRKLVNQHILNYVLAEDVNAKESVPSFRASIVDGYAIRSMF